MQSSTCPECLPRYVHFRNHRGHPRRQNLDVRKESIVNVGAVAVGARIVIQYRGLALVGHARLIIFLSGASCIHYPLAVSRSSRSSGLRDLVVRSSGLRGWGISSCKFHGEY